MISSTCATIRFRRSSLSSFFAFWSERQVFNITPLTRTRYLAPKIVLICSIDNSSYRQWGTPSRIEWDNSTSGNKSIKLATCFRIAVLHQHSSAASALWPCRLSISLRRRSHECSSPTSSTSLASHWIKRSLLEFTPPPGAALEEICLCSASTLFVAREEAGSSANSRLNRFRRTTTGRHEHPGTRP